MFNVQCSMNVEDCVISKICNGNSIMVNTVMLENYKVNCWDIRDISKRYTYSYSYS